MKKITKPAEREEATYYSDFSGKCFGELHPPVEIKIEFNYGSKHDGAMVGLHLTDEEAKLFLDVIKKSASENYKAFLRKKLEEYDDQYQTSCDFRDWDSCELTGNSIALLQELLDIKEED